MADVIMPKMSDAMTEGKVLSWRKRVGDPVKRGEVIAEIETDKVNVEIEAEASGTLAGITVPEGQTTPVGSVIAHINGAGARAEPASRQAAAPAAGPARLQPQQIEAPEKAAPPPVSGKPSLEDDRMKVSPLARRLAAERDVDLSRVTGSGPGGRIVERDIAAALEATPRPTAQAPPTQDRAGAAEYEDIELSRMRQAIARSVVHSVQVAPHFYLTGEVDMGRALDLRGQLKAAYGESEGRVTVNDLILKATALALRRHPDLNAQFIEPKSLRRFHRIHLGIMVAVPDGLVLPVLRDADRLPILQLAREARRLIDAARQRQLKQEEYTGATFSVSNLGMYPVTTFAAIISAPQAGILAVGRIQERPAVREGQVVARPMMDVTISADHRVTDGVGAAEMLAEVKRLLENPVVLIGA
jgi:pyruvate dehydrogenase E2 component (dihydrolipoamide acetyltransferase)